MTDYLLFLSLTIGCLICAPLFKYMYKAVSNNAPEFDKGYKKELKRDAANDFFVGQGSDDTTVNSFVLANIVVMLLPLIPAGFLAVPIYFLLKWILQVW